MAFYDHHFKRTGGSFLGKWKDFREDGKLLDIILSLVPHPKIVEAGPGYGYFATHCKNRGVDYEAVEPNSQRADFIKSLGFSVQLKIVPPMPFPDNYCDVFFASQVIEHMPDRLKAVEFVQEACRIVKPGGWVVLTAPVIASWREIFWDDYTHNYPTSPRRLVTMFQDLGLSNIETRRYCSSFFGPMRYLILLIGKLVPYHFLDRVTDASARQGFLFNLKVATLERFLIIGNVPHHSLHSLTSD